MSETINAGWRFAKEKSRPQQHLSRGYRCLSLGELIFGSAIVFGHNVYHVIPNEVPILFVVGMISVRLRNGSLSAMGLRRPDSWPKTVVFAFLAAAVRILIGSFVVDPVTEYFWPAAIAPTGADKIPGNVTAALVSLLIVWTFAAFGEEISYRGYLVTRAGEAGDRSNAAYWVSVVAVSVLFGVAHRYKGPSGMIDSGFAGLVLGVVYLLSGRNLWVCILAHGFIDTCAVIALFLGISS